MDRNASDKIMKNIPVVFFSGGGNFNNTKIIDNDFIRAVRKTRTLSILFIPTAKNTDENGYVKCGEWLRNKLDLVNAQNIQITLETDLKKCVNLEKFGGIYIGGGNTYKLQKLINESGFRERLLEYVQSGGVLYGASAGSVILGSNIAIYMEENEIGYYQETGLSLCKNYAIRCHYSKDIDDEKIWKFVNKYKLPVIALPLGDAILLDNNQLTLIGNTSAFIFNLSKKIIEIISGEKL